MAMGRKIPVQQPLFVRSDELAAAPRHRFYEKLNELLAGAGFDAVVEEICAPFFAQDGKAGRISTRPGLYFRMLFIGRREVRATGVPASRILAGPSTAAQ